MGAKASNDEKPDEKQSDVSRGSVVPHGRTDAVTLDERTRRAAGLEMGEETVAKVVGDGEILIKSFSEALDF